MTTPPSPSLQLYQSSHRIDPVATDDRGVFVCGVDRIRIHPTIAGGWRHDKAQIVALIEAWIATIWPGTERAGAHR